MSSEFISAKRDSNQQLPLFDSVQHSFEGSSQQSKSVNSRRETLIYLLALNSVKGVGFKTLCNAFETGLLWSIFELEHDDLIEDFRLSSSISRSLIEEVSHSKDSLLEQAKRIEADLFTKGILFVSQDDEEYPKQLYRLAEPPKWLFYTGNLASLHTDSVIAVVGTRKPSTDGSALARKCSAELVKRNFTVLSGLATGIDENAHIGAVRHYGRSVAILGHGLEFRNTKHNQTLIRDIIENDGVIATEYLPEDPPSRNRFLRRNELIAALAKAVIPIESPSLESGTGSTIRRAQKISTAVVGVTSPYLKSKELEETRQNLVRINVPVYTVGNGSDAFWDKLREIYVNHEWDANPVDRQDRFFRKIIQQIKEAKDELAIEEESIDYFIKQLKKSL